MRRIAPIALGLAIAIAVAAGGSLLGTGRAAATTHPTFDSPAPGELEWTAGHANTSVTLSSASGGTAPLTYSLVVDNGTDAGLALPQGFGFDMSLRELSSTEEVEMGSHTLRYSVVDSNNKSAFQYFDVTVYARPSVSPVHLGWTAGIVNSDVLPAGTGGTAPLSYSMVTIGFPGRAGFAFNVLSRELSGTDSVPPGLWNMVYTVRDANGVSASAPVAVTVNAALSFGSGQADLVWTAGIENTAVTLPAVSGGTAPLSYSLTLSDAPGLPTGFSFMAGPPSTLSSTDVVEAADAHSLVYTVTDDNGVSHSETFDVTVNAALSFGSGQADLVWTAGIENTAVTLPVVSGGTAPLSYTLVEDGKLTLPSGFGFDVLSRELSSTASVGTADSPYSLVYTVADANGASVSKGFLVKVASSRRSVRLPVYVPDPDVPDPDDLVWTADSMNTSVGLLEGATAGVAAPTTPTVDNMNSSVVLPAGSGGVGRLSYSVTLSNGWALPAGFEFNASTRMLTASAQTFSSMLAMEAVSYALRYTATDARRVSASQDFTVTLVSSIPDVDRDAPYRPAVVWMVANGITRGCAQDRFCPDDKSTRRQLVTFLWRAVGRPTPSYAGSDVFSDVAEGSYSDLAIGWASATGLTSGCTSGQPDDPDWRFCPAGKLTRAQTAAFLYRFLEVEYRRPHPFEDVNPDSYYANAVAWLHVNNIISSCEPDRFCPYQTVSRADLATFMYRITTTPSSWATDRDAYRARPSPP